MVCEVSWKPHAFVSALHAAEAMARGVPLADARLAEAIRDPTAQLVGRMRAAPGSTTRMWRHLIPLAATHDSRRHLVETAVRKVVGNIDGFDGMVAGLTVGIAALESAVRGVLPNLAEELPLRERPLREQWEARAPGLFHQLALVTEEGLIPETCAVVLVHPAVGGAGEAHLHYNSVRIEAVLANPADELPEVVRLAWLIGQLQHDLPVYSDHIHADRLPHVARFALLPATLAAAERVELARFDEATICRAIAVWGLKAPADVDATATVLHWWETYTSTRPPWRVALTALDQMFG
jgi:hypothetical protein